MKMAKAPAGCDEISGKEIKEVNVLWFGCSQAEVVKRFQPAVCRSNAARRDSQQHVPLADSVEKQST